MDVLKLCRSCMKEVGTWDRQYFGTRAVEMFSFCTNIRITDDDKLPKQFCYDCIIKIESSYTFINEAQKVNVTLKNIISRSNTSVIVEPESAIKTLANLDMRLTLPEYKICSVIENNMPAKCHINFDKSEMQPNSSIKEKVDNSPEPAEYVNSVKAESDTHLDMNKNETERKLVNSKEKGNTCPICRKSFMFKGWYDRHMQTQHVDKILYKCNHCGKSFSSESQLTSHAVSHSDERKFPCSTCGKRYKRRKQLTAHARSHTEARPFSCDHCSARFKTKSILKCHMSVHDEQKPFLCSHCGCRFSQGGNLKVHMRLHTGEKPFSCGTCGFRAAAASNLRRHLRTHAAGAGATHACLACGKGFREATALTRHTRTHTGELPYKCPSCPSSFCDSWKRKTHLMRTHKMALQDIPKMRKDGTIIT